MAPPPVHQALAPTLVQTILMMLHQPAIQTMVLAPLGLIALDILTGIASSCKHGTFSWKMFPSFLGNDLFRYMGGCSLVLGAYIGFGSDLAALVSGMVSLGPLSLGILASIRENWQEVVGTNTPLGQLVNVEASALQQMSTARTSSAIITAVMPAVAKAQEAVKSTTEPMPSYQPSQAPPQQSLLIKDPTVSAWMQ